MSKAMKYIMRTVGRRTMEKYYNRAFAIAKKEVFDDIEKAVKKNSDAPFIMWVRDFQNKGTKMCITAVGDYWELKKYHLSALPKPKEHNKNLTK